MSNESSSDSSSGADDSQIARIADEFVQQLRKGQQPQVEEFARRYPELATVLRTVLPALAALSPTARPNDAEPGQPTEPLGALGDFQLLRRGGPWRHGYRV